MIGVMMDKKFVLAFRLLMGWTFLYAGAWQVLSPDFSAASFLAHTKTFHDLYAPLTSPTIAPTLTFLVSWGHLLIGLSLVFLPGPAFVVIPLGLAILASEFAWARRYLNKARELLEKARKKKS